MSSLKGISGAIDTRVILECVLLLDTEFIHKLRFSNM